jgi:hypothetical protein
MNMVFYAINAQRIAIIFFKHRAHHTI